MQPVIPSIASETLPINEAALNHCKYVRSFAKNVFGSILMGLATFFLVLESAAFFLEHKAGQKQGIHIKKNLRLELEFGSPLPETVPGEFIIKSWTCLSYKDIVSKTELGKNIDTTHTTQNTDSCVLLVLRVSEDGCLVHVLREKALHLPDCLKGAQARALAKQSQKSNGERKNLRR